VRYLAHGLEQSRVKAGYPAPYRRAPAPGIM
jgi:hypothetical protein